MENKRDANTAGLMWPTTAGRGTNPTSTSASTTTRPADPTSTPSASVTSNVAPNDPAPPVAMDTYTAAPAPTAPFPAHSSPTYEVHHPARFSSKWYTRSISRSSLTPTILVNSSSRRSQPLASRNVEILNIISMVFRAIGSGHCGLRIIGVTILKFLFNMAPTHSMMNPLCLTIHLQMLDVLPLSLILHENFRMQSSRPRQQVSFAKRGEW